MSEENAPEIPQESGEVSTVEVPQPAFSDAAEGGTEPPKARRGRPAGSKNKTTTNGARAPRTPRATSPAPAASSGSEDLPPFAVRGLRSMRVVERMTYPAREPHAGKVHMRLEGYVDPRHAEAIAKAIGTE